MHRVRQFLIHNPDAIVHLCPVLGYHIIICMIFFQIRVLYPDGWDPEYKNYHIPSLPVPRENLHNIKEPDEGITFVTAYFNIGIIQKGDVEPQFFNPNTYKNWMTAYSKFNNSVILFTDSSDIEILFLNLRKQLPREFTRVVKVEQEKMWAFQLAPKIKRIYSQPGYPKHTPNTVNERYSCAMHAKYEALETVIRKRMSNTKHLAWIDAGYFREEETQIFKLEAPPDIKEDHVAFMQMRTFYGGLLPHDIIRENLVWIAGGMFIGQPDVLLPFLKDYKLAVETMISQNVMSTDQQVLYTMYSKETVHRVRVPVQVYYHKCRCDWFFIGALCRHTWKRKLWPRPRIGYFGALAL